jgi:hypothetical protein
MSAIEKAEQIVNGLADSLTKITLFDFFKKIHVECYPNEDISFMEYFLEICEKDNQFVINHSKLIEYGIMISNDSSKVKKKLDRLGMLEGEDYKLAHVGKVRENRGEVIRNEYLLTPDAFKLCLIRALRRGEQAIDPIVYGKYYLRLEKVFKWYNQYEKSYLQKLLSMKDDKIDKLLEQAEEAKKRDEEAKKRDEMQSKQIAELLGYAKDTKDELTDVKDELVDVSYQLVDVKDELVEVKTEVNVAKTYLEEKSFTSTKNPKQDRLHHYFAVTTYECKGKNIGKMISGQKSYVTREINKLITPNRSIKCGKGANAKQHNHTQKLLFGPIYNANGIDLRQNVMNKYNTVIREVLEDLNMQGQAKIDIQNDNLKTEIVAFNKNNSNAINAKKISKRLYSKEKLKYVKLIMKDVPITVGSMIFTHEKNDIFSYNKLLELVKSVNEETQTSPLADNASEES